jgi:hypothetical protein
MTLAPEAALEVARRRGPRPPSPYVGLVPFGEDDARFFFGRFEEVALVGANLRSARLTLLYGPSGVGKTSLLQAGVVPALRRESRRLGTESPFAVCVHRSWLDDPVPALEESARAALQELAGEQPLPPPEETLAESLRAWTDRAGPLLLVLDQFEEYFQYHPGDGDGDEHELTGFGAELARIVNDPGLAVHVLLALREDAWPRLDRFEGHIPSLFLNYLRVEHLDAAQAREAIEGPVGAWNRTIPPDEEPYYVEGALVKALLAASAGSTLAGEPEAAGDAWPGSSGRIEAPFLQLALERLWEETVDSGARTMSLATLEKLGGARHIVESHLLEALGRLTLTEQDIASDCFRFLVTSARTKVACPAADLADWTRRPEPKVTGVLDELCSEDGGRILRTVTPAAAGTSYELFHDVLAEPILAWRRRHEAERRRRELHRRLVRFGTVAIGVCAIFAALAAAAWIQRDHANNQLRIQRDSNGLLEGRIRQRLHQQALAARHAKAQALLVVRLRGTNRGLAGQTAQARTARDIVLAENHALRERNHALAASIARLNAQDAALARQVTGLDAEYRSQAGELDSLTALHGLLAGNATAIAAQTAALGAQLKALTAQNDALRRKASALGLHPAAPSASTPPKPAVLPPAAKQTAQQFAVPGDVAGSDSLRPRVESLTHRLAVLVQQRAHLADEAAWYRKANGLLGEQRDTLRKERVLLVAEHDKLEGRKATLKQNRDAAVAEHARLAGQASAGQARNAKQTKALAASRKANGALQDRTNGQVAAFAGTQAQIVALTSENLSLSGLLDARLEKVLRAAAGAGTDPKLGGLLAVEAYRLTPYDPDDAAHPAVYNTLWRALDRLDAAAAAKLIAPSSTPAGKLGTTTSAKLAKALCARAKGTISRSEWASYFPADAPYTPAAAKPCA